MTKTLLQQIDTLLEEALAYCREGADLQLTTNRIITTRHWLRDFVLLYGDPEQQPEEYTGPFASGMVDPLKGAPRTRRWSVCTGGKQRVEDKLTPLETEDGPHPWLRVHKERCIAKQVDLHRNFAKAVGELVKQERTVGDDTAYVAALAEVFRLFNAALRLHEEK